jgi:hypothetical protein
MTRKEVMQTIITTAFKSLSEKEKESVVEELLSDLDRDFTKEEWRKLEKISREKCKSFASGKEAKSFLNGLR